MKYVKLFENFSKVNYLVEKLKVRKTELEEELDRYGIKNYTISSDDTIDIDGDVDLRNKELYKIPFKFGKVTGDFDCSVNYLESLKGCPSEVGGYFYCLDNKLTNLIGSPVEVGGRFSCRHNNLKTLEGMSIEVGGNFICNNNKLKSFDSISNIEGYVYCDDLDISKFEGYCKGFHKLIDGLWVNVKKMSL